MRNLWVLSLLVCVFCVTVVFSFKPTEGDDAKAEEKDWKKFKAEHRRMYTSSADGKRRKLFRQNRKAILAHNKKFSEGKLTYKVEINKFADWTDEEYNSLMGFRVTPEDMNDSVHHHHRSKRQAIPVPDSIDWRNENVFPPVRNQGGCGSCWAFSAVGALEAQYAIKYKSVVDLSEQYALDCTIHICHGGCHGAMMHSFYDHLIKSGNGAPTSSEYPYLDKHVRCRDISNMTQYGKLTKYISVPKGDEQELKRVVGTIGPVSFALNVQELGFKYYASGVFNGTYCDPQTTGHAMVIVGYGTDANGIDYWIIRNSWGPGWGEGGYSKIIRNQGNRCGVATYAVYPVLA